MHHVVIVGGGFGGLYAAKKLANKKVKVTLIDKRNFHLFQPLLYQVATGGLSPGDISSPIRAILNFAENISVLNGVLEKIDIKKASIYASGKQIFYDSLILATGVSHHYFGNDQWAEKAPGLKTIEDALLMRKRVMQAFEEAEFENNDILKQEWLRFVIIGGGPTGVELAGALGELAFQTLRKDFKNINLLKTEIYLIEGFERILPTFPDKLSQKAYTTLQKLGVIVKTGTRVISVEKDKVIIKSEENTVEINAKTILWAAGVKASETSELLKKEIAVELDKAGRIYVNNDLTVKDYSNIYVVGDLAHFKLENDAMLPGVAPVAMQQGRYVAGIILKKLQNKKISSFKYKNKGSLAVIGRKAAVAELYHFKIFGWVAWLIWIFIHIAYLIEFDNKLKVMLQWAWNFFTRKRGARLITNIK